MELNYKKIYLDHLKTPVNLYFLGDTHIGHINHDSDKFKEHIELIKQDKNGIVMFMGDIADGRNPDHKFFDYEQVDTKHPMKGFLNDCYKDFKKTILPIKHQIIGIHCGNHDIESRFRHPYVEELCSELKIKYLGYRALTKLAITTVHVNQRNNYEYVIFSCHGSGGGRKIGAKINRIEEEQSSNEADIYVQGHNHTLSFHSSITNYLCTSSKFPRLLERERYFINAGCYLKSYQEGNYSYSEKHSYKPQKTGCVKLEFLHGKLICYEIK